MSTPLWRVVLVGFMGAGKSTVGPLLAGRLGWGFRDLDAWIEAAQGRRVAEVFAERGEEGFRRLEEEAAREAAGLREHVIAAGGGAFAREPTRRLLQEGALTVWLRCEPGTLLGRIPEDGLRPLAANRERIRAILAAREPYYRLADVAVDTTALPPDAVAARIVAAAGDRLGRHRGESTPR